MMGVVAVDLYLLDFPAMMCLVHLQDACHQLLRDAIHVVAEAVLYDEDRWNDLYSLESVGGKSDRCIGHHLPCSVDNDIEVAQIDFRDAVSAQECCLFFSQTEVGAPEVHSTSRLDILCRLSGACCECQEHKQRRADM